MDEEIERLVVAVRADTQGFSSDIAAMRRQLDGPLAEGLDRAGSALERGLLSAVRRGQLGFEDLRRVAMGVLADIAAAALRSGIDAIFSGGGGAGGSHGGLLSGLGSVLSGALGLPGRATGGPVSPHAAYRVGERGPELFVPTSAGRIDAGGGGTFVNLNIRVSDNGQGSAPQTLQRSARHVARAVRQALGTTEG